MVSKKQSKQTKFDLAKLHNKASKEEVFFDWWLDELIEAHIIMGVKYQPKSFVITEPVKVAMLKQMKTKTTPFFKHLLYSHVYTADWIIDWHPDHEQQWTWSHREPTTRYNNPFSAYRRSDGLMRSVIDVKGTFNGKNNTSATTFPLNQKAVFDKYNILVQRIVPSKLFEQTFTPLRYTFTDTGKPGRTIDWKVRTLEEYLETLKKTGELL